MTSDTTKPEAAQPEAGTAACLFDDWFDPIETGLRARVRELRDAHLTAEQIKASAHAEGMTIFMTLPALIFGLIFLAAAMLKIFVG